MTDNSARDETDTCMSEVTDDIPIQSACSTCKVTQSEMTTDTGNDYEGDTEKHRKHRDRVDDSHGRDGILHMPICQDEGKSAL